MPTHRVSATSLLLEQFDVIGEEIRLGFVGHVGLAAENGEQTRESVTVREMGPPIRTGLMIANARGRAELSDGERRKIKDFVDRHTGEHASFQQLPPSLRIKHLHAYYCIYPHSAPFDEEDGRYARTRFSCSGFVFEAYKGAEIHLVDEASLPPIDLDTLKESYPDFGRRLDDDVFRDSMGLTGTGSWRVLMCGYLFWALSRDAMQIRKTPYSPRVGDWNFI